MHVHPEYCNCRELDIMMNSWLKNFYEFLYWIWNYIYENCIFNQRNKKCRIRYSILCINVSWEMKYNAVPYYCLPLPLRPRLLDRQNYQLFQAWRFLQHKEPIKLSLQPHNSRRLFINEMFSTNGNFKTGIK